MGNLRSVAKAIEHVAPARRQVVVTSDPDVDRATPRRVVFPGQGAMPDCMASWTTAACATRSSRRPRDKPFLGICIGLADAVRARARKADDRLGWACCRGGVRRFRARGDGR